jgi:hypothetical protein
MELTDEQAREYLASVGITLPPFMLTLLVAQANSIDACLIGAGYSDATALLIKLYAIGLLGVVQGDRYVTSQRAPSGAGQSFRYGTLSERYSAGLSLLNRLDTAGCAAGIIPPDPTGARAFFGVSTGGGCCQ